MTDHQTMTALHWMVVWLIPISRTPSFSSSISHFVPFASCLSAVVPVFHSFCSAFYLSPHLSFIFLFVFIPQSVILFSPFLSLLPHSVTLGGFHNLELSPKSQTSSFLCRSLSSSISSSPSISLPFPLFIPSARIFLDIHIYNLNFSYIFSPSPSPLSPPSCFQYFMRE